MIQWNIAVAIPVNVSLCLLYIWYNYITVVSLHQHYNTFSAWFLDIRIYQLILKHFTCWLEPKWHSCETILSKRSIECTQVWTLLIQFYLPVSIFEINSQEYCLTGKFTWNLCSAVSQNTQFLLLAPAGCIVRMISSQSIRYLLFDISFTCFFSPVVKITASQNQVLCGLCQCSANSWFGCL